jgi:predicted small secreted protein
MRAIAPWAIATSVMSLAACTGMQGGTGSGRNVQVAGHAYDILQLTDSTWAAVPKTASGSDAVVGSAGQRAELIQLIEVASGCKVTDIDFARRPAQLDTQVDCAGRGKN